MIAIEQRFRINRTLIEKKVQQTLPTKKGFM